MSRKLLIVAVLAVVPVLWSPVMPAVQHTVAAAPAVHFACGGGMSQGSDTC